MLFCFRQARGIGPHDATPDIHPSAPDALGGGLLWAAGASLSIPVPALLFQRYGLRMHTFADAGCLANSVADIRDISRSARVTVGAGLVLPTSLGILELNYAHVLRRCAQDRTSPGVRFGLRFNFNR